MTIVQTTSRIPAAPFGRLVCHPTLPLAAAVERDRPAVHLYDTAQNLRRTAVLGADSAEYGDIHHWERKEPVLAWHPERPELIAAVDGKTVRWTPENAAELNLPAYRNLAFSADGRSLLASPSPSSTEVDVVSDVIDLATATVQTGPYWDTGIVTHPAGGLVAALRSEQGGTMVLFSRNDSPRRFLKHALVLDADGYRLPVFRGDGRYLAVRGNAYEHMVAVFEFPSLRRVLNTSLDLPGKDEERRAWAKHNFAFAGDLLWIGTPSGSLVELDVERAQATEHELFGSAITALATTSAGALIVASGSELALIPMAATAPDPATVADFLARTTEVPDETHLVLTDGVRTWDPDDLAATTEASPHDPTWLQLQAAINARQG
ncbi:hypothetical protein [Amycolatopsis jejuensis]|uniref:hypothetical protein n=1 Tax=Amycolatopsis jejuensis TaxID=330084 RepID=UPI00068A265D|nr:hypothetical protein [Amycolatopsis jejuensis]